jgi:hypothetical protein
LNLKRLIVPGVVAGAIAVALTMPIGADDNISVSVTPLVLSVSANIETVDYGTLPYSPANDDRSTDESSAITVTNNGSVPTHIDLRGANAEALVDGQDDWTLSCDPNGLGTVGNNLFVHKFGAGSSVDFNGSGIFTLCSDSSKRLASNVALAGEAMFVLQFAMPTGTNGFGPRSSSVTVIAVAP